MNNNGKLNPALLAFTVVTLLGGLYLNWLAHPQFAAQLWNLSALLMCTILLFEIGTSLLQRKVGVDLIALLSIAGAVLLEQSLVAAVIALMLASGRTLEYFTAARAQRELKSLIDRAPRFASRLENGHVQQIPVEQVIPGDLLVLRMGEVVPVDGVLVSDSATLDEAALTGEPLPVTRHAGDSLRSGGVNVGSPLQLRASQTAASSTYAGIVRMAQAASESRAPFARLADQYALAFIPLTLVIAGTAWLFSGDPLRALAVLVVATPCPLILAVPIAIMSGISRCAHRGILVKDGATLEALAEADILFLDKTGTLTSGHAKVQSVETDGRYSKEKLLYLAASLAQSSPHPISTAVVEAAAEKGIQLSSAQKVEEQPGAGLSGMIDGHRVTLGTHHFITGNQPAQSWDTELLRRMDYQDISGSFIGLDGSLAGAVLFADPMRIESPHALRLVRRAGIQKVVMLTGDRNETAQMIGLAAGVDEIRAGLDPAAKVKAVQQGAKEGRTLMVGDGINDAPALAVADVGIALGASGATASSEAAGVVLLADRLDRVAEALQIAKRSRRIAKQGVLAGMGLSIVAMLAAAFGFLPALMGAVLQELIDVAVILNALRALGGGFNTLTSEKLQGQDIDNLKHEHAALAQALELVHVLAGTLTTYPIEQAKIELQKLLELLDTSLLPHEHEDENTLYPMLAKHLKGEDPMSAMSHTHREIFRIIQLLNRMCSDFSTDSETVSLEEIQRLLVRLDTLLELHFAQENELYHILDQR